MIESSDREIGTGSGTLPTYRDVDELTSTS